MDTRSRKSATLSSDKESEGEKSKDHYENPPENSEEGSSSEEEDSGEVSNDEGKSIEQVKGEDDFGKQADNTTPESVVFNTPSDTTESRNTYRYLVFIFVAVMAAIAGSMLFIDGESEPSYSGYNPKFNYSLIYENGLQKLQEDFKSQTDRFWKILKSRGLAHLKKKYPPQPLVMLFVAPPSAHNVVDCFTKKLAANLDPQYSKRLNTISGKKYSSSPGHTTKEELDNKLKDALQSGNRVVVIQNLELLPPPSPMLFHSYCDNDNAPYKHVSILFTVHLPREPDPMLSPVQTEGLVEDYLSKEVWADGLEYNLDAVAALLSRITDTVVIVSGEDEAHLKSVCDS